jgi:putative DNA primase/helicase
MSKDETGGGNGRDEAGAASWNWPAMIISMCAAAGITECNDVVISDVLEGIKSGRWRKPVEQVRKTYDRAYKTAVEEANPDPCKVAKDAVNSLKKRLPGVTPSGRFTKRASKEILAHSGILCLDVDKLDYPASLRERLESDRFVLTAFVSPSGRGLKVWVRILPDTNLHYASFLAAKRHFKEVHLVDIDGDCKDLARLCFVSDDPDMLIRTGSVEILEPDAPEPDQGEPAGCDNAQYTQLVTDWGEPYSVSEKGNIFLNQMFFVARFAVENVVLHEPDERRFYTYDASTGAWVLTTTDAIKITLGEDWQRFAQETGETKLIPKRTNSLLESLVALLRGYTEKRDAFKSSGPVIHCANGMLELSPDRATLCKFSPLYYSRNPSPLSWDPSAECPRFLNVLLKPALGADDISVVQRWFGALLLGGNLAQRIMFIVGTPAGGKSTLVRIIEAIVGPKNVCQLRTDLLAERFETSRFIGKTLLAGKDVSGNFLQSRGAHVLKALVGDDQLSGELKNLNATPPILGKFDVVITRNSHLRVKLDGDAEAWRRRVMIVAYERPKPEVRIARFAEELLETEGPGILRFGVEGAMMHLRELEEVADFQLTAKQTARVDALLAESDSLKYFASERIYKSPNSDPLPTDEIVNAYWDFCRERDWMPLPRKLIERALPDVMMDLFRSSKGTHATGQKGRLRGYSCVKLARPAEEP